MAEQKNTRWSKTTVTDAGADLLTEFAAGRFLTITGAFGSVSGPGENLAELTQLPDGRAHPLTIESVTKTENNVTVCVQVTSLGNPEPYKLEQIGIFAAAGDDEGESRADREKLLMVIEDPVDERGGKGVTVPAETDQLYTFKLYAVLTVTNKERLEISVSAAGIATMGAIEAAIRAHEEDSEAHAAIAVGAVDAHNRSLEAHLGLAALIRAMEREMNGSETILVPDGDPTPETAGEEGQRYINVSTGTQWECTGMTEKGEYIWELVDYSGEDFQPLREVIDRLAQGNTGYRVLAVYGKGDGGPEGPVDPGEPEEPGDTGELEGPGGTENPDGGGEPEEPGGPVDPENPEGPESPDDSGAEGGEG